ncbi:MAG: outer membrane protein assembly factor BamD [Alphaproteobacteria bacterium]|nr:outer membrane protein assembly factor BamD [Alphaproteobacteria bacterium]
MRFQSSAYKITILATLAFLSACAGGKKKFAYVERPVETLYQQASDKLEQKRYDEAVKLFEEVERQHPYSPWARRAMLMKAFSYYETNDYDKAVDALDQFITLHPGNKDAPYAYYLKAICYYEQITDVGRDQENTNKAVAALNDLIQRYPNSEYARDARLKLDLTYDHLAGKEMYVGRFYLKQNAQIAAINRFKYVINHYQTTSHVPEALERLTEAYLQLGVVDEARQTAAVLGYNYPGSKWYADAYELFKKRGLIDKAGLPVAPKHRAATNQELEDTGESMQNNDTETLKHVDVRPPEPDRKAPAGSH